MTTHDIPVTSQGNPTFPLLFPDASPYCLGNTLQYIGKSFINKHGKRVGYTSRENATALIGVFEDDLLNGKSIYKQLVVYATRQVGGDLSRGEDVVMDFYANLAYKKKNGTLSFKYNVNRSKGFEGKGIRQWAFGCIGHACIDYQRRQMRHWKMASLDKVNMDRVEDEGDGCNITEILEADSQTDVEEKERSEILSRGINGLPLQHRQIIEMCYFQGLKYREIAQVLGIPIGTVKSRMHTAVMYLRESKLIEKLDAA